MVFSRKSLLDNYLSENKMKTIKIKSEDKEYWENIFETKNEIKILFREENRLGNIYYYYLDSIDNIVYEVFFGA